MTGIIYKITCLLNNKIYIGKTTETLEARIKNHIRASAHYTEGFLTVSPLYEDIQKYGVSNFKWDILGEFNSLDELELAEKDYIKRYNARDREIGYNIAEGGLGNDTWSTHPKKELFAKLKREQMTGDKNPMYNRTVYSSWVEKYGVDIANEKYEDQIKAMSKSWEEKLGKERADELKKEYSERFKNRSFTPIWRQRISDSKKGEGNSNYGKKWMCNYSLKENKTVLPIEIDALLSEGWVLGRVLNWNKK